jgi:type I restriction enzyme M protein
MKKIKKSSKAVTSPFDRSVHKTERTAAALLMHWMRQIIENENLDLGLPDVETAGTDKKMPDLVIYENRRSNNVLCLIEAKQPFFNVFNDEDLKEPARKKATQRGAKYFATTNFKKLIWFNTEKVNALKQEEEQIVDKYNLSEIENLNDIESYKISEQIKKGLKEFLTKLYFVHTGKEAEPKLALDDLLIFRIQEKIRVLAQHYKEIIDDQCHKESKFANSLKNWFVEQGWSFSWTDEDFVKAARQTAYLLVNKILFYDLLQVKRPDKLDPLEIPMGHTRGSLLKSHLQGYFNEVLKIDYETIYTTDFIDEIAFPDRKEIVEEIKEFTTVLKKYDFSTLGFDVIGRIFERIIPEDERHILGQYFTNADVVDLILKFCIKHEDDKVLDPSCGAGTFLVRAYQHKKLMNQRKDHIEILDSIWGNDIAKFPAHLATINLAINDLSIDQNYPNILHEDFFALHVGNEGFEAESWRKRRAKTLGKDIKEITYPRWFDAIIGNPPYTRQEEIPDTGVDKEQLIESALMLGEKKLADISKRAGIHAYFFVHGTKFLKDGGYFGFIVSSLWLDSDYGKGLQEFFLKNYKIVALIESKVERWFSDADINTCIVILSKCNEENNRDDNKVRFVYLKKRFRKLIPPVQKIWERQLNRSEALENIVKTILSHNDVYENDDMRIFVKDQKSLWEEGFDYEEEKYVGANWAKYIRAPDILFDILKLNKKKLIKFSDVAKTRFGIKTGANEFFYLKKDEITKYKIEKEFLQPIIFSLKETPKYKVELEKLKRKAIICWKEKEQLRNKSILKYINKGEKAGFQNRPTCKSRNPWYALGKDWEYAPLIFPAKVGERMPVLRNENIYEDKKFYGIFPKNKKEINLLGGLLNSTITRLFTEFSARQLTGAQAIADIDVKVVEQLPVIDLKTISEKTKKKIVSAYKKLLNEEAEGIFEEISSDPEQIGLDKIKPVRRELDKVVMEEVYNLNEEQQIKVYAAVVDMVKSRLERSDSVSNGAYINNANLNIIKENIIFRLKNGN